MNDPSAARRGQDLSRNQRAWARFRANRLALVSSWVLAALLLVIGAWPAGLHLAKISGPRGAAFAGVHEPDRLSEDQFQPPNTKHWFRTDVHGRGLMSPGLAGGRYPPFRWGRCAGR